MAISAKIGALQATIYMAAEVISIRFFRIYRPMRPKLGVRYFPITLTAICEFNENRLMEHRTFLTGVNEITVKHVL